HDVQSRPRSIEQRSLGLRLRSTLLSGTKLGRRGALLRPILQKLPRPFDSEPLLIKKALDLEHLLHILAAVEPMPGARLLRTKRRKLRFPEPQHVWLNARELRHIADAEVELVRDPLGRSRAGLGVK